MVPVQGWVALSLVLDIRHVVVGHGASPEGLVTVHTLHMVVLVFLGEVCYTVSSDRPHCRVQIFIILLLLIVVIKVWVIKH